MKLDLGCGAQPLDGHVGIDLPLDELAPSAAQPLQPIIDASGIIRFDLASGIPWPFANESIESLFSSHVIEHLPACRIDIYRWEQRTLGNFLQCTGTQDALFWFLDEAWRVTQPGGEFLLRWPALENLRIGVLCLPAFQDPTHYRFIPTAQVAYWSRSGREALGVSGYRTSCNWVPVNERCLQKEYPSGLVENEYVLRKEV